MEIILFVLFGLGAILLALIHFGLENGTETLLEWFSRKFRAQSGDGLLCVTSRQKEDELKLARSNF